MKFLVGGNRKIVILLTATTVNNRLIDVYNQLNLVTSGKIHTLLKLGLPPGEPSSDPIRIYSARELIRRAEEPEPYHNFPESFNEAVFSGTRTEITPNYVLYTERGSIVRSGNYTVDPPVPAAHIEGTFEIGVRPSASGRVEVIRHRFFRSDPGQ